MAKMPKAMAAMPGAKAATSTPRVRAITRDRSEVRVDCVEGLLTFAWPGVSALVLLAIVIGALQIWGAIRLRKEIEGEWLLILSGLLSVAFGIALIVQPGTGALALVWLIAWFAILAGCIYIALAFRLKKYPG
jgi:uncharacterized membrane protein HdeD (DUF308 family)